MVARGGLGNNRGKLLLSHATRKPRCDVALRYAQISFEFANGFARLAAAAFGRLFVIGVALDVTGETFPLAQSLETLEHLLNRFIATRLHLDQIPPLPFSIDAFSRRSVNTRLGIPVFLSETPMPQRRTNHPGKGDTTISAVRRTGDCTAAELPMPVPLAHQKRENLGDFFGKIATWHHPRPWPMQWGGRSVVGAPQPR